MIDISDEDDDSAMDISGASLVTSTPSKKNKKADWCVVCHSKSSDDPDIKYHRFPKKTKDLWMAACGMAAYKERFRVCSLHFAPDDYKPGANRFLKSGALPTLNMPGMMIVVPDELLQGYGHDAGPAVQQEVVGAGGGAAASGGEAIAVAPEGSGGLGGESDVGEIDAGVGGADGEAGDGDAGEGSDTGEGGVAEEDAFDHVLNMANDIGQVADGNKDILPELRLKIKQMRVIY